MADPKSTQAGNALTKEEFYGLLARFHDDRDQAAQKYEQIHLKLVKFFQWSHCSSAEDLADETLTRTARKLQDRNEEILDIEAFVWGIARRIRQEGRKKDFKTINIAQIPDGRLSDSGGSLEAIHSKIQARKEQECLRKCLERLPEEDRELFLAYRIYEGHSLERRKKLAESFGLSPGALRVRVIRLRARLEKCIAKCLEARRASPGSSNDSE